MKYWSNSDIGEPTVIQLVPRRTMEPNGLSDYALALATALRAYSGINSVFLSATPLAYAPPVQDQWRTVSTPGRRAKNLADTLAWLSAETRARAVVLHFSGYGYQKRGVPLWLVHGLRIWQRRASGMPLLTIFHELYATGRPWRSSFWLSPVQKRIARSILNLSAGASTPIKRYWDCLLHWGPRRRVEINCMPVFSNVGEPGRGRSPSARNATAVVFGLAGVEDRMFGTHRRVIEAIIRILGIQRIIDVGPRFSPTPPQFGGVPLISRGILSISKISEVLQDAKFGFVAYPLDFIGKSGVFAAYAAHGVIPIVLSDKAGAFDGLEPYQHFVDGLRLLRGVGEDELASIQGRLCDWYASHSLKVQAKLLEGCIKRISRKQHVIRAI